MAAGDAPATQGTLDWDATRRQLAAVLGRLAGSVNAPQLDDLTQEACIRLLRAMRRGGVREPEGMLVTVARRTWIDHLRRRRRQRQRFVAMPEHLDPPADTDEPLRADLGDLAERLELVVQEVFVREGADACLTLAHAYFAAQDWKQVAAAAGDGYDAVRKRWSRCLVLVRRALAADPDFADLIDRPRGSAR